MSGPGVAQGVPVVASSMGGGAFEGSHRAAPAAAAPRRGGPKKSSPRSNEPPFLYFPEGETDAEVLPANFNIVPSAAKQSEEDVGGVAPAPPSKNAESGTESFVFFPEGTGTPPAPAGSTYYGVPQEPPKQYGDDLVREIERQIDGQMKNALATAQAGADRGWSEYAPGGPDTVADVFDDDYYERSAPRPVSGTAPSKSGRRDEGSDQREHGGGSSSYQCGDMLVINAATVEIANRTHTGRGEQGTRHGAPGAKGGIRGSRNVSISMVGQQVINGSVQGSGTAVPTVLEGADGSLRIECGAVGTKILSAAGTGGDVAKTTIISNTDGFRDLGPAESKSSPSKEQAEAGRASLHRSLAKLESFVAPVDQEEERGRMEELSRRGRDADAAEHTAWAFEQQQLQQSTASVLQEARQLLRQMSDDAVRSMHASTMQMQAETQRAEADRAEAARRAEEAAHRTVASARHKAARFKDGHELVFVDDHHSERISGSRTPSGSGGPGFDLDEGFLALVSDTAEEQQHPPTHSKGKSQYKDGSSPQHRPPLHKGEWDEHPPSQQDVRSPSGGAPDEPAGLGTSYHTDASISVSHLSADHAQLATTSSPYHLHEAAPDVAIVQRSSSHHLLPPPEAERSPPGAQHGPQFGSIPWSSAIK